MRKLGEQGKGDILIREISDGKDGNLTQLQKNGLSKSGPGDASCISYLIEKQVTPTLSDLKQQILIISQFLRVRISVAA